MDYIDILELTENMIRGCAQAVATLRKVRAPVLVLIHTAGVCLCGIIWELCDLCSVVPEIVGIADDEARLQMVGCVDREPLGFRSRT